jgi:hypothetical protein
MSSEDYRLPAGNSSQVVFNLIHGVHHSSGLRHKARQKEHNKSTIFVHDKS